MTQDNTSMKKPIKYVRFGVVWPAWLRDALDSYCQGELRKRNWMIKQQVAGALGLSHKLNEKPDESDETEVKDDSNTRK